MEEAISAAGLQEQTEGQHSSQIKTLKQDLAASRHQVEQLQEECRRARWEERLSVCAHFVSVPTS